LDEIIFNDNTMMIEVKVPSPGESITEVQIAHWFKKDGDYVEKDEELCEIDSDKATLTLNANAGGKLKIMVREGETVSVDTVICTIDESAGEGKQTDMGKDTRPQPVYNEADRIIVPPSKMERTISNIPLNKDTISSPEKEPATRKNTSEKKGRIKGGKSEQEPPAGELEKKSDVPASAQGSSAVSSNADGIREQRREKMSMLRKRVAERLVAVKQQSAMLTTFNEVDMSAILTIRKQYKDKFKEIHGVSLGFMSFFTKTVCEALKTFPAVNAQLDGDDIIYHEYCDIGIAVSAPKGLMVPIVRNAESLTLAQLEQQVLELATKAREGKISIDEMTGGTFTITNGGVFGSMLSTPIINPPQSAILGMHNIVERPVAINGKVVVRPIMYVALSYDHRVIDGRESVSFLVKVKQLLENPEKMLFDGNDPVKQLLGM
jgi:2-oxoglutarate dehydrogenase E2 component (dihydrolipoamide succinyltransferase)